MTVNHSGALSVAYFEDYLKLAMKSHNLDLDNATKFVTTHFFKNDLQYYGAQTHQSFVNAIANLQER
jgi:hypothetical protein